MKINTKKKKKETCPRKTIHIVSADFFSRAFKKLSENILKRNCGFQRVIRGQ